HRRPDRRRFGAAPVESLGSRAPDARARGCGFRARRGAHLSPHVPPRVRRCGRNAPGRFRRARPRQLRRPRRQSVTASVGIRAAALAAIALVAIAVALALTRDNDGHKNGLPSEAGPWYTALAAPYAAPTKRKSACGVLIDAGTVGVAHPVLPCGVKLYVQFRGKTVLTHVID